MAELEAMTTPNTQYFCDTETIGFYGEVRLLQVRAIEWDEVCYIQFPGALNIIKWHNDAAKQGCTFVYQNAHYDLTTYQQQGHKKWVPEFGAFIDTMLAGRLALPHLESHSLDNLMTETLGFDPYAKQGLDKKTLQGSDWSKKVLTNDQLLYACTDVWFLPNVLAKVSSALDSESYLLDMHMLHYCLDFQWNGVPVDIEKLQDLWQAQQRLIADLRKVVTVNPNSWQQVRKWIGQDESDDLALAKFAQQGCEKSASIRKLRKALKLAGFLEKFQTEDGRIYGKVKPSAKSGRTTSDDQNIQQLPRASKGVFGTKGLLLYADYAQLELRTICAISRDGTMEELFREGKDLHTYASDMLLTTEESLRAEGYTDDEIKVIRKKNRQIAKTGNFSLLYGGGAGMFIDILVKTADIWLDHMTASVIKRQWLNLFRGINAWQQRGISNYQRGKLGSTPLGRRYKAKLMTDQLNIENQGAGAEVAKLAMHYLYKSGFKTKYPNWYVCNFIHDSFILENPNPEHDLDEAREVAVLLADCMQRAWFSMSELMAIKDLPMPVEVSCGQNWGDIESDNVPNLFDYKLDGMATYGK